MQIYRKKEKQGQIFHLLVYFPSAYIARAEPVLSQELGASSNFLTWVPGHKATHDAFPDHKEGVGWQVEQLEHELAPLWDAGAWRHLRKTEKEHF